MPIPKASYGRLLRAEDSPHRRNITPKNIKTTTTIVPSVPSTNLSRSFWSSFTGSVASTATIEQGVFYIHILLHKRSSVYVYNICYT